MKLILGIIINLIFVIAIIVTPSFHHCIDTKLDLFSETILEVELLFRIYRFLLDAHIPFGVISISIEESGM